MIESRQKHDLLGVPGNGKAFLKGGVGCLLGFVILGLLAVVVGGSVTADAGGILLLFAIGGLIGLIVNWIYQKGRKNGDGPSA